MSYVVDFRRPIGALLLAVSVVCFGFGCSSDPEPSSSNSSSGTTDNACVGPDCTPVSGCGECAEGLVCDETSETCVECLVDAQCAGVAICDQVNNVCACPQGTHLCDKECLPDDSVGSCGDRCQSCPSDPNGTATCEAGACGLQCADGLLFDPASNSCVECATSNDCADPSAPVCVEGICGGCSAPSDCAGRGATPICEPDSGACVACTAADSSGCGDFVCDLDTNTCGSTLAGSLGGCEPCSYDAECSDGFACVPSEFQGTRRQDNYCYPFKPAGEDCPGLGYATEVTRTSAQGEQPEVFCAINESLTTCEAVRDYGTKAGACSQSSDCGVLPNDARCEVIEFDRAACTYLCDSSADCPSLDFGCLSGAAGEPICGGF